MTNTAKVKLANSLKNKIEQKQAFDGKTLNNFKYYEASTQGTIPVKNIQDEMIITRDGRFLSVLQILPIPFDQKSLYTQFSIINTFTEIFRMKNIRWMLEILNDEDDSFSLQQNIKNKCVEENNAVLNKGIKNHTEFLKQLGSSGAIDRRYYFIWEYSGEEGRKSKIISEIAQTMWEQKQSIIKTLTDCGNIVLKHDDENYFLTEFLYRYFNRQTYKIESVYERYARMNQDIKKFNALTGMNKTLQYTDLISPKGLYFINRNYHVMDGKYYGYIGFNGDSWPLNGIPPAWLNRFNYGPMVDITTIGKMYPHEPTIAVLKPYEGILKDSVNSKVRKGISRNLESRRRKHSDISSMLRELENGDDTYDVSIILTIRADSPDELYSYMRRISSDLKHKLKIEPDTDFLCCEEYFTLTMPLLYLTPTFSRLKHNVTSTRLRSFYSFVSTTITDPNGYIIGKTNDNQILSIDNFNTDYFENANMAIFGTSGAGKTFLQQLIGHRMRLNGKRCFFIIPKKGYEYKRGCNISNGTYIPLYPGSKDVPNFLEIRPENEIDESKITDDTLIMHVSLLTKKINSIILWLQLNMEKDKQISSQQYDLLTHLIRKVYANYGITDDNDSIYENKKEGTLKLMPIFGDLYKEFIKYDSLEDIAYALKPFVDGQCKNLNQRTNVDLNNKYIVFDCDEDIIGEKWLASFLYIAFDFVYSAIKSGQSSQDVVFLDEVWKMMKTEECAKQVFNIIKLVRGYGGGAIVATQELNDFLSAHESYGRGIINNCATTIFLKMKENDLKLVRENYKLTEEECEKVQKFKRKQGLLIANGDKIYCKIIASKYEENALKDRTSKVA